MKKRFAGIVQRRTRKLSQEVYAPLRSLLNECHWRSATPLAQECAEAHSLTKTFRVRQSFAGRLFPPYDQRRANDEKVF